MNASPEPQATSGFGPRRAAEPKSPVGRAMAALFAVATAMAAGGPAYGQGTLAARVEYKAPPGCPSSSDFEKRLRARSARVRIVASGPARALHVEIVRRADGFWGTLRIGESAVADRRRSLKATRCDDTVDGLALIAAVALDTEGANDGGAIEPESSPARPPEPPPASAAPPAPPPPPSPPTLPLAEPVVADRETPAALPASQATWHLFAGVGAGGLFGQAPGTLAVFNFFAGTEWLGSPWWSPQVRAGIVQSAEAQFSEPEGVVHYGVTMGMLEASPFRFGSDVFAIRPSLVGSGGVVNVSGSQTAAPESHSRWRWHIGGSLLAAVHLAREFGIGAGGGFLVTLRQDRYAFAPNVFFSDPAVSAFARLELSVAFP